MRTFSDFAKNVGLAMAGKSPWGGNAGGRSGDSESGSGDNASGGGGDGGSSNGGGKSGGPRNPWLPGGDSASGDEPRRSTNIEDIFKKRGPEGPRKGGGNSGGPGFQMPMRPSGKSWWPIIIGVTVFAWLALSMSHRVQPKEQGVVTFFGSYSRTLAPGFHFTLPAPFEQVDIENVSEVRAVRIPNGEEQKLILTGDQNLVNLSYLIRWNIKDLAQFKFQLADPIVTVEEVAEAAMREMVARKTLDETFSGQGRAEIEQRVRSRMQNILDAYQAGVAVQGVEIDKTDPPAEVVEAFKDVSAAEQDADAARNRSRATAQQILARAEGETEAFDKVYREYRLAPQVTRQRLYYETMERVLSQTDKTIVEAQGVTPYLPLPEIRRRAQQPAPVEIPPAQGQ